VLEDRGGGADFGSMLAFLRRRKAAKLAHALTLLSR
jgi:hypothetical protein